MNKIAFYITLSLGVIFSGCSKFLEKEPDNRAKLSDGSKISQLLGTAYPQGNFMAFTEALSDNSTDKGAGTIVNANRDPYFFEDVQASDQDSPDNYWAACYTAIAASNQALQAIMNSANPSQYNAQKGEALLTRAYAHFMLVTLYSRPYDPATAASEPGIPYATEPETVVIKQYDRGTVASVYAQIEKDITEGLPLLNDDAYDVVRYHFNRSAGNAFAARFYLYKKDYPKVVQYATASVPNFLPNLRPWNTTYQQYDLNQLPLEYQKTNQLANLLLVSCPTRYNYNFNYGTYRYGMDNTIRTQQATKNPVPVAGGTWSFKSGTLGSQSNQVIPKLHMRDFAYETPTSDFGLQYGTICLFTVEEVLFNKAEANAYLNNPGPAIADLNTYLSTRLTGVTPGALPAARTITEAKIQAYYPTLTLQQGLIQLILDYKRAEYVQEGMRWFDILRYKIPVSHRILGPGGVVLRTEVLGPEDPRRRLKIPDAAKLSGLTDLNR